MIRIKRVYEKAARGDGTRVLVDRLWPRGLTKRQAAVDTWLRELAPSDELRKWFHARPDAWHTFCKRYLQELSESDAAAHLEELNHKRQREGLTAEERQMAEALRHQYERAMLVRAEAMAKLKERGHDISALLEPGTA